MKVTRSNSFEIGVLRQLCLAMRSPVSDKVLSLIESNDLWELINMDLDPNSYTEAQVSVFRHDYLITSFLKKSEDLEFEGLDLRKNAMTSFFEGEKQCRLAAHRLSRPHNKGELIGRAGRIMARILGPLGRQLPVIQSSMGHGPGSTLFNSVSGCTPSDKYSAPILCTPKLMPFMRSLVGDRWFMSNLDSIVSSERMSDNHDSLNYYNYHLLVNNMYEPDVPGRGLLARGNVFCSVRKNAKTDRGICLEPLGNQFLQKGIGSAIRKQFAKFGIDLNIGESRHAAAVRYARQNKISTLDVKNASGTIANELIYQLLMVTDIGREWWHLLDVARSPETLMKVDGKDQWIKLYQHSSMGNGYTFELESCVFYAICLATAEICGLSEDRIAHISTYGDDILVPREIAESVIDNLSFCGFELNVTKSFVTGLFFESCGHDYFYDHPVRPFYARNSADVSWADKANDLTKKILGGELPYSVKVANLIRIYSHEKLGHGKCCPDLYRKAYGYCLRAAKLKPDFPRVPKELGHVGLIVPYSEGSENFIKFPQNNDEVYTTSLPWHLIRYYYGHEGGLVKCCLNRQHRKTKRGYSFLLDRLNSIGSTEVATYGRETVLRSKPEAKMAQVEIPFWDDAICWTPCIHGFLVQQLDIC